MVVEWGNVTIHERCPEMPWKAREAVNRRGRAEPPTALTVCDSSEGLKGRPARRPDKFSRVDVSGAQTSVLVSSCAVHDLRSVDDYDGRRAARARTDLEFLSCRRGSI